MQGIRHQCKEMFENIVKLYKHFGPGLWQRVVTFLLFMLLLFFADSAQTGSIGNPLIQLAEQLLSLDSPSRGQFVLLSSLTHHLSTAQLVASHPNLPTNLLAVMGHQALACHVSAPYDMHVHGHVCYVHVMCM